MPANGEADQGRPLGQQVHDGCDRDVPFDRVAVDPCSMAAGKVRRDTGSCARRRHIVDVVDDHGEARTLEQPRPSGAADAAVLLPYAQQWPMGREFG